MNAQDNNVQEFNYSSVDASRTVERSNVFRSYRLGWGALSLLLFAGTSFAMTSACDEAVVSASTGGESASMVSQETEQVVADQDESEEVPSPWTPEVLDTGVDLSEVETDSGDAVAATDQDPPAPAPVVVTEGSTVKPGDVKVSDEAVRKRVADAVRAHDEEASKRRAPGVFAGGAPDEQTLAKNPESGYIHIEEKDAIRDFGNLRQGDKVDHVFELSITGENDVVVDRIQPSCGCTVSSSDVVAPDGSTMPYDFGAPLKPGSKLHVKTKLDTKKKRDRMVSVLTVLGNDPRGSLQLRLMANVVPFFEVSPSSLNFGQLRPSQVVTQSMTISSAGGDVFALSVSEELIPAELSVKLEPIEPGEDGRASTWKAEVTLGPKIPEGARRTYTIQFNSDQAVEGGAVGEDQHPTYHTTVAYAVASVTGQVSAIPTYMSFGLMKEGQSISRIVRIENHDEGFELTAPKVSLVGYNGDFEHKTAATIEVTEVNEGRSYDVKLTMVGPKGLTGTFRGKLSIAVGHPDKEFLVLPFTGVVRSNTPSPRGAK